MAKKTRKKAASRLADARARMYHDLIFESAEHAFGRKGYEGTTMQDIADEAGISLKTLYATYESKQDLYAEIMRSRASAFIDATATAMAGASDPVERVDRGVRAYVAFLFEHENWLRIHLRTRVAWSFRPSDDEAAAAWQQGHDDYAKVLADGIAAGVFYDGDPQEMSIMAQAIMQVQVARAAEHGVEDPDAVADTIMVQLRRLLCRPGANTSAS